MTTDAQKAPRVGEHFVAKLKKPLGITVGSSSAGVMIAVVEATGAAHMHNIHVARGDLVFDDDDEKTSTGVLLKSGKDKLIEVGDVLFAASESGTMVTFENKSLEEVVGFLAKGTEQMTLELIKGTGATKSVEEIKSGIETHSKRRFENAEKFVVKLAKPMGIQIGDSPDGVMIATIDEKGSAARWNQTRGNGQDEHDIRPGDVILAASNKAGEMVNLQDRPIDEILTFFKKTANIMKLQLGRLEKDLRMSDATAVIMRHNSKRDWAEETSRMGNLKKFTCQQWDHPPGALEDDFTCFNYFCGLCFGPCGIWYCLNHKQRKCRRCYMVM